jgi:hypothetical protein
VQVLDYSAKGAEQSYTDSRMRMSELPIHGLRVHDADTPARLKAAMAKDGAPRTELPQKLYQLNFSIPIRCRF